MARKGGEDRGLLERPKDSGVWWIRYHDHLGKERREKVGSKAAARNLYQARKNLVREIKLGLKPETLLTQKNAKPLTLKEFLESITPELESKKSWRDDKRFCKNWVRLIGDIPLKDVSPTHAVRRRTARLAKGAKPATINRESAFLKMVLFKAVRDGHLEANPLAGFKLLKENNEQDRFLTGGEEERLEGVMDPEDFELVAVALDTGMRQGEQFRLPWTDVNFEDGWIVIPDSKSGKGRSVPFTDRVEAILKRRYQTRTGAWVFPNQSGSNHRLPSEFIRNVFKPALEAAGIRDFSWHKLRHTTGTRLAQRGVSEGMIGALLGHTSNKTTKRYVHHTPGGLKSAVGVLNTSSERGGLSVVR